MTVYGGNVKIGQALRKEENARILFISMQVALDVLMNVLAFLAAYRLRLLTPSENLDSFSTYSGMMAIQVAVVLIVFMFSRLYQRQRARSRVDEIAGVFGAVLVAVLITIALTTLFYKERLDFSRLMVFYDWILTFLFVSVGRIIHDRVVWHLRSRDFGVDDILLVGTTDVARMIHQKIMHSPGLGYRVMGYITDDEDAPKTILGAPVLGKLEDTPSVIGCGMVSEVIVALPDASRNEILEIISMCERGRVSIKVFPDVFQIMASEVSIGVLDGLPLLTIRDPAMQGWKLTVKRAVDVAGSGIGLILLSPFLLLTALLIKLDSPGPAFYYQERMGLDAKPFLMVKFRSMRQDAESHGPGWTTENDPRRTRLGSLIRRLSIDEFPQLINVLLGHMSLVGPRPERPMYVEQFRRSIPRYMDRHREKAGMTGWAQVNGLRGDTSISERTKYDLWYVENWSLLLDFKIVIQTLVGLLFDRHAY